MWLFFFLMIRRPPRSTQSRSSAASDVYKRQVAGALGVVALGAIGVTGGMIYIKKKKSEDEED